MHGYKHSNIHLGQQKRHITRRNENAFGSKHIICVVRNNKYNSSHEFMNLCCGVRTVKMPIYTMSRPKNV